MRRGIITSAHTMSEYRNACGLAYSLKQSNPGAEITLVTTLKDLEQFPFDEVVAYPFPVKVNNIELNVWQLYWASPYEYTIYMSNGTVVNQNLETQWDYLMDHHDICFGTRVLNFRNEACLDYDDRIYTDASLTYVNSDCFYWAKDREKTISAFKIMDAYSRDHAQVYREFLENKYIPKSLNKDLLFSIALSSVFNDLDYVPYHPAVLQSVKASTFKNNDWMDVVNVWYIGENDYKIQNHNVAGIVCHNNINFITEEKINEYRSQYTISNA